MKNSISTKSGMNKKYKNLNHEMSNPASVSMLSGERKP